MGTEKEISDDIKKGMAVVGPFYSCAVCDQEVSYPPEMLFWYESDKEKNCDWYCEFCLDYAAEWDGYLEEDCEDRDWRRERVGESLENFLDREKNYNVGENNEIQ